MTTHGPDRDGIFPGVGPWGVVHGRGVHSEDAAGEAVEQAIARSIEVIRLPIDDWTELGELAFYLGLVLILPDTLPRGARLSRDLAPYRELVTSYRARRPCSASDALLRRKRWWEIGVVQIVGYSAVLGSGPLRTIKDLCCARHPLDGDHELDFLSVYNQPATALREQVTTPSGIEIPDADYLAAVDRLRRWSISTTDAAGVLAAINNYRQVIESNPRRAGRHRPIANVRRNRLDLILDGPPEHLKSPEAWQTAVGANRKAWQEADAEVWRDVYGAIRKLYTGVQHPNRGHTGAVQGLRELYNDLRIVAPFHPTAP
ncbi:hypothetical protein [Pseudonocardia sp. ICBG162]|uniref:hypothetical protein n=1 Tax=Pseudonocardia sp. ICBG162 TaxID=2846761 RepID=UPI001CF6A863|nr:hypothetical protein [Pseudonocardia sp. ICBG162]